jgi:very-short-patch-repair endonuclease
MTDDFWESKLVARRGHLKYLEELRNLSRKNRSNMTKTESILWNEVLRNRMTGYKFLRQKPIYRFILDFYCRDLLLAIEVDGGYHKKRKNIDETRDQFLRALNIETLRIRDKDIELNLEEVRSQIQGVIKTKKGKREIVL